MLPRRLAAGALAALLFAACSSGGGAPSWPHANGDYAAQRAALEAGIDSSNVGRLEVAWTFEIPGSGPYGAAATNPVVAGGRVYFQDLESNTFALDLETGERVWADEQAVPVIGPNGVALAGGLVFALLGDAGVIALDRETGDEVWSRTLAERPGETVSVQPLAYAGLVLVSTVAGIEQGDDSAGVRGMIYALDAGTGETAWRFSTVDSEDVWGNPEVNSGGGAWYPPAVDTERGVTYWGTANPGPWPGTAEFPSGASRPGANLYTDSTLALDAESGELLWHRQARAHDLFDLDYQLAMYVDGEERDVVVASGKAGTVSALDAATGGLVWETAVGRHQNDGLAGAPEGEVVEVYPGVFGGVETPLAYAEGLVFAPVVNLASRFSASGLASVPDVAAATGELVALRLADGSVAWRRELPAANFGGATVAGDLVFTATLDGTAYAFDRETGEEAWRFQLPGGVNGWPAVAGDTIVWPCGAGGEAVLVALRVGG